MGQLYPQNVFCSHTCVQFVKNWGSHLFFINFLLRLKDLKSSQTKRAEKIIQGLNVELAISSGITGGVNPKIILGLMSTSSITTLIPRRNM